MYILLVHVLLFAGAGSAIGAASDIAAVANATLPAAIDGSLYKPAITLPNRQLQTHGNPTASIFFKLALTWPESFRIISQGNYQQVAQMAGYFTIHGLWPHHVADNTPRVNCPGPHYRFQHIQDQRLLSDLVKYWKDLSKSVEDNKQHQSFWRSEWQKHGSCSEMTQSSYFFKATTLTRELALYDKMWDAGIYDDVNHDLPLLELRMKLAIGWEVELICEPDARYAGTELLEEIRICYDGRFNIMDCPNPKNQYKACAARSICFP